MICILQNLHDARLRAGDLLSCDGSPEDRERRRDVPPVARRAKRRRSNFMRCFCGTYVMHAYFLHEERIMFDFNPQSYRYASKRHLTYAPRGMACTAQPLAAQAGLRMLMAWAMR